MRQLSPSGNFNHRHESQRLQNFVFKNDVDGVRICIKNDVMSWNTKDVNGMTPLMVAATLNRTQILQILIDVKCDVNATDEFGNTALHLAVDEGNTDAVRKLVQSGRCITDAINGNGETALMRAAFYDYHESARIILKDGLANPDIRNRIGQSALLIALQEGSHMTADVLLKSGCDVMISDDLGRSAMFMAIHSPLMKSLETAKSLIHYGYDINIDRIWLLNEEKHNLFYQDDHFYSELRRSLRNNSVDGYFSKDKLIRKVSSSDRLSPMCSPTGSPKDSRTPSPTVFAMSPTVKEKIMASPGSPKFAPIPFSKLPSSELVKLKPTYTSPLHERRSMYKNSSWFKPVLTTPSDSDDFPIGNQTSCDNVTSNFKEGQNNLSLNCTKWHTCNRDIYPTRQKFEKSLSEGNTSAHACPLIKYKRQISAQPVSQSNVKPRKISMPAKPAVKFCTEIQIYEIKRH